MRYGVFLILFLALQAALTLFPSGILITGHEGDLLHMIDAGVRMASGEIPHLDFMTPIGILGIAPFALFIKLGSAAGEAAVLANLLVGAILLPAVWWVGSTRLSNVSAWFFGGLIVVLSTALIHGGGSLSIAMSMYYNRWCWAIVLIILVTLLFPARDKRGVAWVDPVIIGLGMAALMLTKMTFFVPLALAVILILVSAKRFRLLGRSLLIGAIAGVFVIAILGIEFVFAYADNLLAVASGGAGRSYPGLDIAGVLSDPEMISGSFVLLATIVLFRKFGRMRQGLVLLILSPAFIYITFQNWGNDPKWLFFVMLYLAAYLPKDDQKPILGMAARQVGILLIAVAATSIAPSAMSLIGSTTRAAFANRDEALKIPLPAELADLWMPKSRILVTDRTTNMINELPDEKDPAVEINGAALPDCIIDGGFIALTQAMVREIETVPGVIGSQVLTADVLNVGWLMGDLAPVKGAATWYYDDYSGFDTADYLMVPVCPLRPHSRNVMVEKIQEFGWEFEPVLQSDLMVLYRINR